MTQIYSWKFWSLKNCNDKIKLAQIKYTDNEPQKDQIYHSKLTKLG